MGRAPKKRAWLGWIASTVHHPAVTIAGLELLLQSGRYGLGGKREGSAAGLDGLERRGETEAAKGGCFEPGTEGSQAVMRPTRA